MYRIYSQMWADYWEMLLHMLYVLLCLAAVLLARGSVLAPEPISSTGSLLTRGSEAWRPSSSSALIRVRSCMLKLRSLSDSTP